MIENCNRNKTKANFIEVMAQGFSKKIYMNIFYIIYQDIRIYICCYTKIQKSSTLLG